MTWRRLGGLPWWDAYRGRCRGVVCTCGASKAKLSPCGASKAKLPTNASSEQTPLTYPNYGKIFNKFGLLTHAGVGCGRLNFHLSGKIVCLFFCLAPSSLGLGFSRATGSLKS